MKLKHSNGTQNNLGFCYEYGIGTEKDLKNALCWYQIAAENGNNIAQCNLGEWYELGKDAIKDEIKWYEKSVERENDDAQFKFGYFYENGIGIDLKKAVYYGKPPWSKDRHKT